MTDVTFPREAADITPDWLSRLLGGAVDALAEMHAHWWDSSDFPAWLPQYSDQPYPLVIAGMYMNSWPRALEIFGDHLTPEFKAFGERWPELVPFFMEGLSEPPFTLCHGDFRLD